MFFEGYLQDLSAYTHMGWWYLSAFLEALSPMQRQLKQHCPSVSVSHLKQTPEPLILP
jgi:hypothetical protein